VRATGCRLDEHSGFDAGRVPFDIPAFQFIDPASSTRDSFFGSKNPHTGEVHAWSLGRVEGAAGWGWLANNSTIKRLHSVRSTPADKATEFVLRRLQRPLYFGGRQGS
jgi:hypothetical protein